jgi:hypothetical protein
MKTTQKRRWFKAKEYGWGWTPVTWEGWLTTLLFAVGYACIAISYVSWFGTATDAGGADYRGVALSTLEFLGAGALLTYVLFRICIRFGEKPSWRWGKK